MTDQFEPLKTAIIAGAVDQAIVFTETLLASGSTPREILDGGLLPGMEVVGDKMRSGECFIPEVLLSARTMQAALDVLKPRMSSGDSMGMGAVVIGTVEGDLHDIGKNLVAMMLEGSGFSVVNLGTGVTAQQFVAAVEAHDADILGMSALLTTTLPRMKETMELLEANGLRDRVSVLVGGAPVTQQFADDLGADGYGANAALAVERAKSLLAART